MKCVKCDGILERIESEGIELDKCPKCSGIWFDFNELKEVLELKDISDFADEVKEQESSELDDKKGHCPRCGGNGNLTPVYNTEHDIHIDTCSVCYGKWLDGGELVALKKNKLWKTIKSFFI